VKPARFGDLVFDLEARRLSRGKDPVHLSPKAFDLLAILIAHRPRALAKAELLQAVWPGTFVSEGNLSGVVAELRKALAEPARHPRFVRTVHGFGYAFAEPGADLAGDESDVSPVALRLIWGDREIALPEGETVLGRTRRAGVWVESESVSRHHARVVVRNGHATIEDLGSKNGTRVSGAKVDGPTPLADGDEIRLGAIKMVFRAYGDALSTRSDPETAG
jgi:DNA-binding winged helix-turn-helix (wHTH) protein